MSCLEPALMRLIPTCGYSTLIQFGKHCYVFCLFVLFFFVLFTTVMGLQIKHSFQKDVPRLFTNISMKTTVPCKLKKQTRIITFLIRMIQSN